MKKWLWPLLLSGFVLYGCNNPLKKDRLKPEKNNAVNDTTTTNSKANILNGIVVFESGGLQISRAYLSFEDGSLLPKTNMVSLGEPVYLNLLIKKGWKTKDGKVWIDASQKIETADDEVVVNEPSLFRTMPAVKEKEAGAIQLKVTITKTRPGINYFKISYRVWDKMGDGEVKGSYKLW